jgi:hypothetical protein
MSWCLLPLLVASSLNYAHHTMYAFTSLFCLFSVLVCETQVETKRKNKKEIEE